jgi:hypothetical protein
MKRVVLVLLWVIGMLLGQFIKEEKRRNSYDTRNGRNVKF